MKIDPLFKSASAMMSYQYKKIRLQNNPCHMRIWKIQ
jgi:hypothetical protein